MFHILWTKVRSLFILVLITASSSFAYNMATQELQVRLAEIEVMRSTMDEKIIGIFRFDNEGKQKKTSTLLILAEIGSTLYVYERLLDTLNATAEQVRHLASGMDGDPMARFEKIIQRLNDSVARFIEQEGSSLAWGRVNIFVLQIADGHLCFSGIGSLMNVFLQRQASGAYRAFDLLGSLEQPAEIDPKKPFAALVCGDLQAGDLFFLGTLNFQRLREELQIVDRLKNLPPVTAAVEIKQALEETDIPDDFVAVIVAGVTLNSPEAIPLVKPISKKETPIKPKSAESIERLYAAEQQTEAIIDSSSAQADDDEEDEEAALLEPVLTPRSASLKERALDWMNAMKEQRGSKVPRPERQPMALASLRGMNAGYAASLSPEKKRTAWLVGSCVLILIVGGLWYRSHSKAKADQLLWNTVFDQATDNKNRAEADLVYGNEERARRMVTEAITLVQQLDSSTKDRAAAKEKLGKELEAFQTKFRKEQRVDAPTAILKLDGATAANSLNGLIVQKNIAYTLDRSKNQVIAVDLATLAQTVIIPTPDDTNLRLIGNGKDAPLFLSQDETLYTVKNNKLVSLVFNAIKATSTQALTTYGQRIYTLDPAGGMVWRYTGTASGYGSETAYLKQTTSRLQDAVSIAIDSSIYVAHQSGQVDKFLSGTQENWNLVPIDPPLTSAADLWTDVDANLIAVADPAGKRVILFAKDGKLTSQIVSSVFSGPSAVWGDSANKKLYVVDGNQILRFDLP